jgi:hypothetical protein
MADEHDSWFQPFGFDPAKFASETFAAAEAKVTAFSQAVTEKGLVGAVSDEAKAAVQKVQTAVSGGSKPAAPAPAPPPKPAAPSGGSSSPGGGSVLSLTGSVGAGGKNNPDDVKAVQRALGISDDGKCGGGTIGAIKEFQKKLGHKNPDGRVDVGGATAKALAGKGGGGSGGGAAAGTDGDAGGGTAPAPAPDAPPAPAPTPEPENDSFLGGLKKKLVQTLEDGVNTLTDLPGKVVKGAQGVLGDPGSLLNTPPIKIPTIKITGKTLDDKYKAAVKASKWQEAAEHLNEFGDAAEIQKRLNALSKDQLTKLHQGAVDNPRLGRDSQVAQMISQMTGVTQLPTETVEGTPKKYVKRAFQFTFAEARLSDGSGFDQEPGDYEITIKQGKDVLGTAKGGLSLRIETLFDPTVPDVSIFISGKATHTVYESAGISDTFRQATMVLGIATVEHLDPKMQEYTFTVKRKTFTKNVKLKNEVMTKSDLVDKAAAKAGISSDHVISVSAEGSTSQVKSQGNQRQQSEETDFSVFFYTGQLELILSGGK